MSSVRNYDYHLMLYLISTFTKLKLILIDMTNILTPLWNS